jgi:SnoaL-like domain
MSPDSSGDTSRDTEAIKQLKYRYLRTLDLKQWDEFAECFLPDATGDYDGLAFEDRSSLVEYMRANLGEGLISMHHAHHPEISVDGDSAVGRWYLEDKVIVPELHFVLEGAAFYTDHYVRTPEGWRIVHTGYRRTFEVSLSTADLTSYKVKRGSAYDS